MADDFDRARDYLGATKAMKDAGYDASDGTSDQFQAGYRSGRDASNPDLPTTTQDVVDRIRNEYPRDPDQARPYRDGYAAGANRNK